MRLRCGVFAVVLPLLSLAGPTLSAQGQKPLVNSDVIAMVKGDLPESTIVNSIQSSDQAFDLSPTALLALHSAGVSEKILDAMIASTKPHAPTSTASHGARSSRKSTRAATVSRRQPSVTLVGPDTRTTLALEKTTLAQTQTKPISLAALATDKVVDEAVKTGVNAARRAGGRVGGSAAGGAAKTAAQMLQGKESKTMTFVWMLNKRAEPAAIESETPAFDVALNQTIGLRAADYAPAIIKLTPTLSGTLLVGATQGKIGAPSSRESDWPLYSTFVEDRVNATVSADADGRWTVTVASALPPGDYAVVLRPLDKDKRFAGADVARNQGDGLAFSAVWPFSIH